MTRACGALVMRSSVSLKPSRKRRVSCFPGDLFLSRGIEAVGSDTRSRSLAFQAARRTRILWTCFMPDESQCRPRFQWSRGPRPFTGCALKRAIQSLQARAPDRLRAKLSPATRVTTRDSAFPVGQDPCGDFGVRRRRLNTRLSRNFFFQSNTRFCWSRLLHNAACSVSICSKRARKGPTKAPTRIITFFGRVFPLAISLVLLRQFWIGTASSSQNPGRALRSSNTIQIGRTESWNSKGMFH